MPTMLTMSRRELLAVAGAALAAGSPAPPNTPKICIFSKHLQWLSVPDAAKLAADIGFDGVDLTVRKGGHVEPSRVAQDLPAAVEAIRKTGLEVPMVTAGIVTAQSEHAGEILRTISSLGIHDYRWGGFSLDAGRSIPEQIESARGAVRDLAALNQSHRVCAMYHTHSGAGVLGASIWDLYLLLQGFDPKVVGVNFDIAHATIEGGLGGWRNSASLVAGITRGIALKDFYWEKRADGAWQPRWCPIGEGMVRFEEYFQSLRPGFRGPIQLHFEYPEMGGAEDGQRSLSISRDQFRRQAERDLGRIRELMRKAGIARG
jgi:sugar phosphate isomerase/epimerase